jgi:hypothetical protein
LIQNSFKRFVPSALSNWHALRWHKLSQIPWPYLQFCALPWLDNLNLHEHTSWCSCLDFCIYEIWLKQERLMLLLHLVSDSCTACCWCRSHGVWTSLSPSICLVGSSLQDL